MNIYRLTTNGMLYSYRANLQNSYNTLASAMTKVQTNRNFNSYAEDPAAATRAFQLRREHWQTSTQVRNNDGVLATFRQAFSTFDSVKNDLVDKIGKVSTLIAKNDPDGTARKTLGQSILAAVDEAVQSMNIKYDGKFLFAGADGMNTPFTWEDMEVEKTTEKVLYYTQDQIDALKEGDGKAYLKYTEDVFPLGADGQPIPGADAVHKKGEYVLDANQEKIEITAGDAIKEFTAKAKLGTDGKPIIGTDGKPEYEDVESYKTEEVTEKVTEKKLCYRGIPVDSAEGTPEYEKLNKMLHETTYVDIGLGMKEANGTTSPISSTVYNSALNGLEMLDFGLDEDGDPKNIVSLMKEIGELLMTASDVNGTFRKGVPDYDRLSELFGKLEAAQDKMDVEFTELDTKAAFLETNQTRLTADVKALNEQILGIEEIDPVEAITSLSWAQYCYNAGLKIGNSVLSQTLLDYMN